MNPTPPDRYLEIETARLKIRPYRLGDGATYADMLLSNREHLYEFMPPRLMAVQDEADAESVIRELAIDWQRRELFIFGIWEIQSGALIGEIYLANPDWQVPRIELGYFVSRVFTRQGIATEAAQALIRYAFETMEVARIELQCSSDNLASQRVAERCGFKLEGRLRLRNRKKNGQLVDRLWYGLLRSEWVA